MSNPPPETAHSGNHARHTSPFPEDLEILRKIFMTDVGFIGLGQRKDVPYVLVGTVSAATRAEEDGDEE